MTLRGHPRDTQTRSKQVAIRLSQEDHEALSEAARAAKRTLSDYIRYAAISLALADATKG